MIETMTSYPIKSLPSRPVVFFGFFSFLTNYKYNLV